MKKQPKITVISKRKVSDIIYTAFSKLRKKIIEVVNNMFQPYYEADVNLGIVYNLVKENPELDEDVYADMDGIGFDFYGNPVKCF